MLTCIQLFIELIAAAWVATATTEDYGAPISSGSYEKYWEWEEAVV